MAPFLTVVRIAGKIPDIVRQKKSASYTGSTMPPQTQSLRRLLTTQLGHRDLISKGIVNDLVHESPNQ